jgi:hypothetical protein
MQAELKRILELQGQYRWDNTPAMQERGQLIRSTTATWLRSHAPQLAADIGLESNDFFVEGRDGTGRKTRVPWIRFGSYSRSPSATTGFYVVYLFDAPGNAVYLSLNQGTTDFVRGGFMPKPVDVLEARVLQAREVLGEWFASHADARSIELHDPGLGAGYERGNIAAIAYPRKAIPNDTALLSDARVYARALRQLYADQATHPLPYEMPEVEHAIAAAEEAAGKPARSSSAGFRTNAEEIKLIERHAVRLARLYYEADDWDVSEYGKPFDLKLNRDREQLDVEVKGTTSDGSGVVLTAGEVRYHEKAYPNNALVVVRNIELDRSTTPPTASGGALYGHRGWQIAAADLTPISYTYAIPAALYTGAGCAANRLLPRPSAATPEELGQRGADDSVLPRQARRMSGAVPSRVVVTASAPRAA